MYQMKTKKLNVIIYILMIIILLSLNSYSLASSIYAEKLSMPELSEEFKEYNSLSEEEKNNKIVPELISIPKNEHSTSNLLKNLELVGASATDNQFNLMTSSQIGDTMRIKDQQSTSECWAFSSLSSLETNLSLKNKKNNVVSIFYDFSERHMDYSCVKALLGGTNIYGYNRLPSKGGTFEMAASYLTNGMGAINEADMPFKNDVSNAINISEIQNKKVSAYVSDTRNFVSYQFGDDKTEIIKEMKDHIVNYGSIATKVYSDVWDTEFYNNDTGAAYYDNTKNFNHGVSIIGWDDNYSVNNFNSKHRPSKNGAWIIRNSWGEKLESTFDDMKEQLFNVDPEYYKEHNIPNPQAITDTALVNWANQTGYTVDTTNRKLSYNIGKNGIMYYSYEDSNIYKNMLGIVNASTEKKYDNLYQYNETGAYVYVQLNDETKHYEANKFTRKSANEYLTQVGFHTFTPCKTRVYVNLNGSEINKDSLTEVKLSAGDFETLNIGYHTLEFAEPLKINSNEFAVVLEVTNQKTSDKTTIAMEAEIADTFYSNIKMENSKCFIATSTGFDKNQWIDLSKLSSINSSLYNGDSSVKAYTINSMPVIAELMKIEVTKEPNKTAYIEGENFNNAGMVVTAYYSDNTSKVITDYSISNGSNLKLNQNTVTISYQGKTTTQSITVTAKATSTPTPSPTVIPTVTPTVTPTKTPTPSPTTTVTPSPSPTATATDTPKPTTTVSPTPTITVSPTTTPSITPSTTPTPTQTPEDNNPKNSNLKNCTARVTSVKKYTFKNNSNTNYSLIDIDVNISSVKGNDSLSYYYYLTTDPNGTGIKIFTEIKDITISDNKIHFTLNTKEIPNYADIVNDNSLYLFIEEIAKKGGNQSTVTSDGIRLDITSNIEEYVDGVKQRPNGSGNDNTQADKPIPNTGLNPVMIISTIAVLIIGAIIFIRYKTIDKDMK